MARDIDFTVEKNTPPWTANVRPPDATSPE
jgi:hypothetical protein